MPAIIIYLHIREESKHCKCPFIGSKGNNAFGGPKEFIWSLNSILKGIYKSLLHFFLCATHRQRTV